MLYGQSLAVTLADTQQAVRTFLMGAAPWVPVPTITEWDNSGGGIAWYTGQNGATIALPRLRDSWVETDPWHVIHESAHVIFFYANSRGARCEERFSAMFGVNVLAMPLPAEILAEHLTRAYLAGYDGHNYPQLVGLVPFDAHLMRAFVEGLQMSDDVIEWVGPAATTNFAPGRQGNPITLIIDHWIGAGTLEAAVTYFKMDRPDNPSSAHYIVGHDGRIVHVVFDNDTAYHAGNFRVNLISIGIEHEAHPTLPPTDALYGASAWLHRYLADKYGIALVVGDTVKPHNAIVPTSCPGTLDLTRIVEEAEEMAFTQDDRDKLNRIKDILEAREPLVWMARDQRDLDVETGKPFDASKPPVDQRIRT